MSDVVKRILNDFCSDDEYRSNIAEPFSFGGYTMGSCGRILVAVPEIEGCEGHKNAPRETALSILPNEEDCLVSVDLPVLPPVIINECSACDGSGCFSCDCPTCNEYHDCEYCGGSGEVLRRKEMLIGGFFYDSERLRKLYALSKFEAYLPGEAGVLPFFFEYGKGALMPLRKEEDRG